VIIVIKAREMIGLIMLRSFIFAVIGNAVIFRIMGAAIASSHDHQRCDHHPQITYIFHDVGLRTNIVRDGISIFDKPVCEMDALCTRRHLPPDASPSRVLTNEYCLIQHFYFFAHLFHLASYFVREYTAI
jgi:hypothetical protein